MYSISKLLITAVTQAAALTLERGKEPAALEFGVLRRFLSGFRVAAFGAVGGGRAQWGDSASALSPQLGSSLRFLLWTRAVRSCFGLSWISLLRRPHQLFGPDPRINGPACIMESNQALDGSFTIG